MNRYTRLDPKGINQSPRPVRPQYLDNRGIKQEGCRTSEGEGA